MQRLFWLSLVAGCSFDHGALPGGGSGGDDAAVIDGIGSAGSDAPMVTGDAQTNCWSVAGVGVNVCLANPLSGTVMVSSSTSIDTDSSGTGAQQCKVLVAGSSNVCVLAAQVITLDAGRTLSAHGTRPLVLIANTMTVNGTIDVSSALGGGQRGPASDLAGCGAASGMSGAGGGAGGSFGGKGGDGGDDDGNGNGGSAPNAMNVTTLRGGCPGSAGGGNGAYDGHGGGAVLLIADTLTISSTGRINASGSAGNGALAGRRGGDGGSTGGMIALSATSLTIDVAGEVFANGGHGGGGSNGIVSGSDGTDPTSPTSGGGGGGGSLGAGDGGGGFPVQTRNGGGGQADNDGGGGGGGGAGLIRIFSATTPTGQNISPPAS